MCSASQFRVQKLADRTGYQKPRRRNVDVRRRENTKKPKTAQRGGETREDEEMFGHSPDLLSVLAVLSPPSPP